MTREQAIDKVLEGFDQRIFVRSTEFDDAHDWAMKLTPYLIALAHLQVDRNHRAPECSICRERHPSDGRHPCE